MKVVEYANTHDSKNIVIIAKTMDQVSYIYNQLRRNLRCVATDKSTLRLHNGTTLIILPEYTNARRFSGYTIHVLLFAGVRNTTRDMIKKYLLPNMVADHFPVGSIIGELKI